MLVADLEWILASKKNRYIELQMEWLQRNAQSPNVWVTQLTAIEE